MKIASVQYVGPRRSLNPRAPSGNRYQFLNTRDGFQNEIPIEELEDVRHFEDQDEFEVEYTPLGKIAEQTEEPIDGVESMLNSMGYNVKRSLAPKLGIELEGNPDESTLDEELAPELSRLQETMENQ